MSEERTEKDWERLLEANYQMSDELAGFRLLPCQCPKCGHEHMANVRPHTPAKPAGDH